MEFSHFAPVLLCGVSPFILGWLLLPLVAGIRGDWEAGVRLFLLGFGLLSAILANVITVFYLPDWAAVLLLAVTALWPWISLLRYFVASKISGEVLLALPQKREKWSTTLLGGALSVLLGLQTFFFFKSPLSLEKTYALGILFISVGTFRVIEKIRYSHIRERGILHESGRFYSWDNIESFGWKFGEDKLSLTLKKSILNKRVNLKIPSQFRHEAVLVLSQHIGNTVSDLQEYAPIQKAG